MFVRVANKSGRKGGAMIKIRLDKLPGGEFAVTVKHNRSLGIPAVRQVVKGREALRAFVRQEADKNEAKRAAIKEAKNS